MGKLAETLIRIKEGMGYVPCYKLTATNQFFFLLKINCGLFITAGGMRSLPMYQISNNLDKRTKL